MYGHHPPPTQQMNNLSINQQQAYHNHQTMSGQSQQWPPPHGQLPPGGIGSGPFNERPPSQNQQMFNPTPTPPGSGHYKTPVPMMSGPPSSNSMMPGPPSSNSMMPGPPSSYSMMPGPPSSNSMMPGPPSSNSMMSGPPSSNSMMPGPPPMMSGPPSSNSMMPGLPSSSNSMMPGPSQMMSGPPSSNSMMQGPPQMMSGPPSSNSMMQGPPQMMSGPPSSNSMMPGPPPMMSRPPLSNSMMPGPPSGNIRPPTNPSTSGMMPGPPTAGLAGPPTGGNFRPPTGGNIRPPVGPSTGGMMTGPPVQSQPTQQAPQKINPDLMPNPIAVINENKDKYSGQVYGTSSQGIPPPLVTTPFIVQDQGNCSPRYMRSTLYTVPCTKDLLNQCGIPLGLVIQPFASIPLDENSMCLVDHGSSGPIRCNRCKAYMNPHCRFIDGGRHYECPICQCANEVTPEYFSHLDHTGRRVDVLQRPELMYGTVEYVATKDYCKEGVLPNPVAYIFMIDVSVTNIQSGLVSLLTQTMLSVLDSLPRDSNETSPIRVGFVTYDQVLHFYNVKETLAQPQMMIVSDVSDVFVPLLDGFLVDVNEARVVIDNLCSQLPDMFAEKKVRDVILEPAIRAGMEALKAAKCNGKLIVFHSNLPSHTAPGQLKSRLDQKLLGTDKEKTLLNTVGAPYTKLAEDCVKQGVGLDLFVFPTTPYTDLATLGKLASTTGGELHYYPNFQTHIDGERLINDVSRTISRPTAFDAVMRVRCSAGIRAVNFYGGFYMANTTDIEFGNVDTEKAFAVEIKHDDKMRDDIPAYVQAALLYTTISGQRRLRVHNIALNCSSKFSDIYHSCDIDTLVSFLSKSVVNASLSMPYKSIRENFTHQCAVMLACYRKHCSQQSPPGQLILPDSLKLLPMYANCLLKSDALLSPPIVSLDEKCYQLYRVLNMNQLKCMSYLYPKMMSLSQPDSSTMLRCTGQKLTDDGIYLIDNGLSMVIWIGQHAPSDVVSKIFGVGSVAQIDNNMYTLPALDNDLSFKVRENLKKWRGNDQRKLIITKQRDKSEIIFRRLLKEDKGSGPWEGTSYIDYLCQLHKEIREML